MSLFAPFPYFGGKRSIADAVWSRFGSPKQYIEPFCGSAAMLLAAPSPASLEVIGDTNGFIANFWRAVKYQPEKVAHAADYPVSHIDLGARHQWLMTQRDRIGAELQTYDWPGDAEVAGLWLWGQCCWIGSGWCEWDMAVGKIPRVSDAGMGVQAVGQIPHVSNGGRGVQAVGIRPHVSDLGREFLTSSGRAAFVCLRELSNRLERVRIIHGEWSRCLHHNYGGKETAVFLDPPYREFGSIYGPGWENTWSEVGDWALENSQLRIALCGNIGDYDLPGWEVFQWSRKASIYGSKTKDDECIWFSPACEKVAVSQGDLFADEKIAV